MALGKSGIIFMYSLHNTTGTLRYVLPSLVQDISRIKKDEGSSADSLFCKGNNGKADQVVNAILKSFEPY